MASSEIFVEGVKLENLVNSESPNVFSHGQLDSISIGDDSLKPELRNKVFKNELIRDKIFDYVFSSNRSGKILVNKDALWCRLVDHDWLDYTTWRLQKSGSPEYTIDFEFSVQSKEGQSRLPRKYQVYKFLETWVAYPGAGSRIPLFNIETTPFSRATDFYVQSLVKCLTLCGNGLHHLALDLEFLLLEEKNGVNCTNYVATIGEINLPNLTELVVVLPEYEDNKPLVFLLLSRILSACKRLNFLSLVDKDSGQFDWSMLLFQEILFCEISDTIVKLELNMKITTNMLEVLLFKRCFLPNLSWLKLGSIIGVDNDVVSRIIHRYSRQLKHFFLDRDDTRIGTISSIIRATNPFLTKLKDMHISCLHSQPELVINQSFPILETLSLKGQTPYMLQKWIHTSPFSCVKEFAVSLCDNIINGNDVFTLELSRQLHVAFPYVQKLEINFGNMCISEDGSIQNIFECMPQLRDLTLRPHISDHPRMAYIWDAILLGVTPEYAKTIAGSPRALWYSINLNHHRTPSRSIVNLSHLTKFYLAENLSWTWMKTVLGISDLSFSFAFLCMPNLEMLTLDGTFGATPRMVSEWRRRGRTFHGRVYQ